MPNQTKLSAKYGKLITYVLLLPLVIIGVMGMFGRIFYNNFLYSFFLDRITTNPSAPKGALLPETMLIARTVVLSLPIAYFLLKLVNR